MNCYEVKTKVAVRWCRALNNKDPRDPAFEYEDVNEVLDAVLYVWADTEADAMQIADGYDYEGLDVDVLRADISGISVYCTDDSVTDCSIELGTVDELSCYE